MKHTAEDFKDILAGKPNKFAYINFLKLIFKEQGYHYKIRRRKLASGQKFYFYISIIDFDIDLDDSDDSWWYHSINLIRAFFPKARLTSGSISGWTIAEY